VLGKNDLDTLSGGQWRVQRHQRAINLGTAAAVAEIGVHTVREIDRRRAARQIDDPALRGQDVDRLVKGRLLVLPDPVRGVGHFITPGQQLAQPGDLFVVAVFGPGLAALLVAPVRSNTQFRVAMHLASTDLHFERAPIGAVHGRMQRAVVIAFRVRNVIVELLGNRRPDVVHDAQSGIAGLHIVDDDPYGTNIVDFGKRHVLLAHLVPDAVDVFWPAVDLGVGHAGAQQFGPQPFAGFGDELLALGSLLVEMLRNLLVDRRMQKAEREVLEFPLQFPDAKPVGQR
jgi:hypothetical protein